jgi:copper chaperone CopZ
MKSILTIIMVIGFSMISMAQKTETVTIKTTTYCSHCKVCETCGQKMETDLYYVKGIKFVNYNENDMTITIKFKPKKTNIETIRTEISKLGFSADDVPADPIAYEKLDGCCKKQ